MLEVFAQAAPSSGGGADPIGLFVQYGIAGLVIVALLLGLLWAKPAVDALKERATRAEALSDEMLRVYSDQILPALSASTAINQEMKPLLLDVVKVMERMEQLDAKKPRSRAT